MLNVSRSWLSNRLAQTFRFNKAKPHSAYRHMHVLRIIFLALIGWMSSSAANALDFRSLNENAIVYDGASRQAVPQFIVLRGTPVEVIVAVDKWMKVREASGGLGWVEKNQLTEATQVIVTQAVAIVRQQADESAPQVFSATKDVLLEVMEKPGKAWVKVRHRDGSTGFVSIKAIWGI